MNVNVQLEIYKLAKSKGKRPSELSPWEITQMMTRAMGAAQAAKEGTKAGKSLIATKLGIRAVPLPVYQQRKAACQSNACGKCLKLDSGGIVCLMCGCAGTMMESALKDPLEACRMPPGKRLWEAYEPEQSS